jgi:DNA-directed RNA polymerase specialized sigma24 family protein
VHAATPAPDTVSLLRHVYAVHGAAVYALADQVAGSDAATGITVQAFVALGQLPELLRAGAGAPSVRTWLLSFAHRRAVGALRSQALRRSELAAMTPADVEQESLDRAGAETCALLSELPADDRRSILLAYFGGHTCHETAALMRQPENAVKAHMRGGLSRLRLR